LEVEVPNQPAQDATIEPELQNEAIDRADNPVDGTYQEPIGEEPLEEVDPDAWRNVRIPTSRAELHELFTSLAEKDPEINRAWGAVAGRGISAQLRQEKAELAAELEAEREAKRQLQLEYGNATWGRMNEQQRAALFARDPRNVDRWNEYSKLAQEARQPSQKAPEWLRNMVVDAQNYVEEVAPHLSPEDEQRVRALVTSQETYRAYLNNPHQFMTDLQYTVDQLRTGGNNAAIQAGTTPRPSAPTNSGRDTRNEPAVGNPRIGRMTPDQTPPRRASGGSPKYTRAQIRDMPPAQFEALKKLHGVETGQGLVDAGVVV